MDKKFERKKHKYLFLSYVVSFFFYHNAQTVRDSEYIIRAIQRIKKIIHVFRVIKTINK